MITADELGSDLEAVGEDEVRTTLVVGGDSTSQPHPRTLALSHRHPRTAAPPHPRTFAPSPYFVGASLLRAASLTTSGTLRSVVSALRSFSIRRGSRLSDTAIGVFEFLASAETIA